MGFLSLPKTKGPKLTVKFVMILIIMAIFSTVVLASYIHKANLNTYFATAVEDFYFTSNLLTDHQSIPNYQITHDWQASNTATISFDLRNYENPLNISSCEIAYEVKYTVAAGPAGDTASGTIAAGGSVGNKETINLSVTKPDPVRPLVVTVTATTTSPYSKTLRGKFVITPAISYQMAENAASPVAVLTITLAQSMEPARDVIISWPAGAAPDMTNPLVIAATDAETIDLTNRTLTTSLNTAAVYELVFFKDLGESDYTGVTVTGS